ncbi:hypothetical protein HK101_011379 [Irineochytrium annulatum]|nr:hypothetical protein HK101_011379 [Irineochytrium annulatum]
MAGDPLKDFEDFLESSLSHDLSSEIGNIIETTKRLHFRQDASRSAAHRKIPSVDPALFHTRRPPSFRPGSSLPPQYKYWDHHSISEMDTRSHLDDLLSTAKEGRRESATIESHRDSVTNDAMKAASTKLDAVWMELNKMREQIASTLDSSTSQDAPPPAPPASYKPVTRFGRTTVPITFQRYVKQEIRKHDTVIAERIVAPYVAKEIEKLRTTLALNEGRRGTRVKSSPSLFLDEAEDDNGLLTPSEDEYPAAAGPSHRRVGGTGGTHHSVPFGRGAERGYASDSDDGYQAKGTGGRIASEVEDLGEDVHDLMVRLKKKMDKSPKRAPRGAVAVEKIGKSGERKSGKAEKPVAADAKREWRQLGRNPRQTYARSTLSSRLKSKD